VSQSTGFVSKEDMKTATTFTAQIYVGTREQYTPEVRSIDMAREFLHEYVNRVGLCVTLTPTEFIYTGKAIEGTEHKTNAGESGFVVGLINYPRFPVDPSVIREHALTIGKGLLELFKQFKVSIVFPDQTVMIESDSV
jgi:hypothetical protein